MKKKSKTFIIWYSIIIGLTFSYFSCDVNNYDSDLSSYDLCYWENHDGIFKIHIYSFKDSAIRVLENNPRKNSLNFINAPFSWSADGRKIAYTDSINGHLDIIIGDQNGNILNSIYYNIDSIDRYRPFWTNDDKWLVYSCYGLSSPIEPAVGFLSTDYEESSCLSSGVNYYEYEAGILPSYSTDYLVSLVSFEGFNQYVQLVQFKKYLKPSNFSIKKIRILENFNREIDENYYIVSACISPNGKHIAVVTSKNSSESIIYILNINGSIIREIDAGPQAEWVSWSPDSKWIAYHSKYDGYWNIYIFNLEQSKLRQITDNFLVTVFPCWRLHDNTILK